MPTATSIFTKSMDVQNAPHIKRVTATPEQARMLSEAFRDLGVAYPFLASLAASDSVFYHAVHEPKGPPLSTDGVAVYLNTEPEHGFFSAKWDADVRMFMIAHEISHIFREDIQWSAINASTGTVEVPRTPACPTGQLPYNAKMMDYANDCAINAALFADNVGKQPAGVAVHAAITPHMHRGAAYAIIYQENKGNDPGNDPDSGSGKNPGNGPGDKDPIGGDQKSPGSMGDPEGDESDASSAPQPPGEAMAKLQEAAGERKVAVDRASQAARMAGAGTTAAESMVVASTGPGVDWRSYMQGFLARAAGNSAFDWRRPARPPVVRSLLGDRAFFAPSRGGHGLNTLVAVGDVSGSIGPDELRATVASICEAARELNPRNILVVWCDSQILRIDCFAGNPGEDTLSEYYARKPVPDGGGTDFRPPFEMLDAFASGTVSHIPDGTDAETIAVLMDSGGKPDGLVYITDLCGPAPTEPPGYPVLWLATTEQPHPWGARVTFNPAELVK